MRFQEVHVSILLASHTHKTHLAFRKEAMTANLSGTPLVLSSASLHHHPLSLFLSPLLGFQLLSLSTSSLTPKSSHADLTTSQISSFVFLSPFMATSPVNHHRQQQQQQHNELHRRHPKPLHNFPEAFFKWGSSRSPVNTVHRSRRSCSSDPPPQDHQQQRSRRSPQPTSFLFKPDSRDEDEDDEEEEEARRVAAKGRRSPIGPRTGRDRADLLLSEGKRRSHQTTDGGGDVADGEQTMVTEEGDIREEAHRLWNLRPRRCVTKNSNSNNNNANEMGCAGGGSLSKNLIVGLQANNGGGGGRGGGRDSSHNEVLTSSTKEGEEGAAGAQAPKSMRLRGMMMMAVEAHGGVEKKKERPKLWISLSKDEIEEDIFLMTGSRPPRRPRKRSRAVQKQLDVLFPGLTLVGSSAESFKIPDSPPKV